MPDMSGYEVARRVGEAKLPKRPLLIAVSGHGEDTDRRHSREAGIDLHLVKPADPELLIKLLRRFQFILT
jgi:CheY-like chemotaxis protein